RLIAQVLGNGQIHDGYIVCGSHIVSWCIGHLVKLTPPGELNPVSRIEERFSVPTYHTPSVI
ncbi:hypothetical protein MJM43_32555, partial [Salmonella enterica subsp. enterica serovar Montevideo]|nr:hypothetical protein [Salmonella enterica subsp. enterica serovar Montevideo]